MSKVEFFVKSFLALVQGDKVEVQALKVKDRSINALKSQISSLEGDTIDFKEAVDNAQEKVNNATVNYGNTDFHKGDYVRELLTCKNNLSVAEEKLEAHLETIAFLKERLDIISA